MKHEHKTCKHKLKYCSHCDLVYCEKCNKEWVDSYTRFGAGGGGSSTTITTPHYYTVGDFSCGTMTYTSEGKNKN